MLPPKGHGDHATDSRRIAQYMSCVSWKEVCEMCAPCLAHNG